MLLALGVYLLLGLLFAWGCYNYIMKLFDNHEENKVEEKALEKTTSLLSMIYRAVSSLGNTRFWTAFYLLAMLVWLPVLVVGVYKAVKALMADTNNRNFM